MTNSTQKNHNKVYGYARISTKKQSIERQIRNIKSEYPNAIIIREVFTGSRYQERSELKKLIKIIRSGDTIIFDSVSRFSRNAKEGFSLYQELYNKGVNLVFLKEHMIDTHTYRQAMQKQQISLNIHSGDIATDKLVTDIIQSLNDYIMSLAERQIELAFVQAQKEVDDLRQRTREGIETARRAGKQIGGHKPGIKLVIKKQAPIQSLIQKHSKDFEGSLKDTEVISIINGTAGLHVARNTYYKYKRELIEKLEVYALDSDNLSTSFSMPRKDYRPQLVTDPSPDL